MAIPAQTFKDLPDPHLRYDVATNRFVLLKDYVTPEVTVPAGEWTDGASRPELLNLACKQYDRHLPACLVHDFQYRNALGTKKEADDLFGKNLQRLGFSPEVVTLMVTAVRVGGKGAYK